MKKYWGNEIKIVNDPVNEKLYFGIIQAELDEPDTYTIIARGDNEKEVYENSIIEILKRYNNCFSKLIEIGEGLSCKKSGFSLCCSSF